MSLAAIEDQRNNDGRAALVAGGRLTIFFAESSGSKLALVPNSLLPETRFLGLFERCGSSRSRCYRDQRRSRPQNGDCVTFAGYIDNDLLKLAQETGLVAEGVGELAISTRLHQILPELLELAIR
jgi:hypothetical protein